MYTHILKHTVFIQNIYIANSTVPEHPDTVATGAWQTPCRSGSSLTTFILYAHLYSFNSSVIHCKKRNQNKFYSGNQFIVTMQLNSTQRERERWAESRKKREGIPVYIITVVRVGLQLWRCLHVPGTSP